MNSARGAGLKKKKKKKKKAKNTNVMNIDANPNKLRECRRYFGEFDKVVGPVWNNNNNNNKGENVLFPFK